MSRGLPIRQKDIKQISYVHYRNQILKNFQTIIMSKENKSTKIPKSNKRSSVCEVLTSPNKWTVSPQMEGLLSPARGEHTKAKLKVKKQNKALRIEGVSEDKQTKRKVLKKSNSDLNCTVIVNTACQGKLKKRDIQNIQKSKQRIDKTIRNTPKNCDSKRSVKNPYQNTIKLKNTQFSAELASKKSYERATQASANLPNQEYLFIGDEFYFINNYCPTKRLLNTFRQACINQNENTKFITQDKYDRQKQKLELKKTNIFSEARKAIELKNKNEKATIIQKWWRSCLARNNMQFQNVNPQHVNQLDQQISNNAEEKIQFQESSDSIDTKKNPFELEELEQSPIKQKKSTHEDSILVSLNSVQHIEDQPKKVKFTKEDISKMMIKTYKLPTDSCTDVDENQAIFTNYAKFRLEEAHNEESSQENISEASQTPTKENISNQKESQFKNIQETQFDLLKQFEEVTKIKQKLQLRILLQKGQMKQPDASKNRVGINTSIVSIHNFLVKFFHYYIQTYRDEFISYINMPYGYSVNSRLRFLAGQPLPEYVEQDDEGVLFGLKQIIDGDKFEDFYDNLQLERGKNSFSKANNELQKIHNKAILDYFNEELNQYRPYRFINGIPYPWNHSHKALTFYYVTQQNIAQVFEKVQFKILKKSSFLCGIMAVENVCAESEEQFDVLTFMEHYQQRNHGIILEHNESRELKVLHEQIKEQIFEYDCQTVSKIMLQIASELFQDMIIEGVLQVAQIFNNPNIY